MGLAHSMAEARLSMLVAQQQAEATVVSAQDLAVERLLHRHGDRAALRHFVDEQLGPLIEHDSRRGSALVATLRVFLACGGSKAAAADRLHLRRQSLYYRLRQIAELLEADLDAATDRTALAVALATMRLIEKGQVGPGSR